MELKIYHNKTLVGQLQSVQGGLAFKYADDYLDSKDNYPISLSLPLQDSPHPFRQTERFFDGLLPEEDERRRLARYLQISSTSLTKLLIALAGDCVGNLTVLTPDDNIERLYQSSSYVSLSQKDFKSILNNDTDLITKITAENRLSIPGAQAKIGLYCPGEYSGTNQQQWFVARGLNASNHIIKPNSKLYKNTSLNEYYCSKLANCCEIETAKVWLLNNNGEAVLVSKRFDRYLGSNDEMIRLCQEDFCQVLSIAPGNKYQADGGPGFSQILDILRFETSPKDVRAFIRMFVFNFLIGNCDGHGKNYSIQRKPDGRLSITPAYDLVSTTFYPNLKRNIAIAVGNVYAIDRISTDDFKRMCTQTGVSWPLIKRIADEIANAAFANLDLIEQNITSQGFKQAAQQLAEHLKNEISAHLKIFA